MFSDNNWTFFSRELLPIFKIFKFDWLENVTYYYTENEVNNSYYNQFNIFSFSNTNFNVFPLNYNEFMCFTAEMESNTLFAITDQISNYFLLFYNLNLYVPLFTELTFTSVYPIFFSNLLSFILTFIYIFVLIYKLHTEYGSTSEATKPNIMIRYNIFVTSWLNFAGIKFESIEEAFSIIVLWPWCIILIFTHVFTIENNENFFIFVEWGLPVVYGFLILFESVWLFSTHLLIYLNGARGRRSLLVTLVEDCVALTILISRITLQMVRGLICGFMHDFFREISEYLIDTWELYMYYATWQVPFCNSSFSTDLVGFFIDWYIISFTLLFIYFILFLQLLFLVIAVWLFCRCWFISVKKPLPSINFYSDKFYGRELDLNNIYKDKSSNV